MKQLTLNQKNYLFVEVPEDAYEIFIGHFYGGLCYRGGENKPEQNIIDLPSGNWADPIKASEVTEEQWINIVEGRLNENLGTELFKNYMLSEYGEWFKTATGAGLSIIRSIGMEAGKTVIIQEK